MSGPISPNGREPLLSVRELYTAFETRSGLVRAVNGVSFDIFPGETLGIVGESGSGKSVSTMSILGLIEKPAGRILGGQILYENRDISNLSNSELRHIRGRDIAMVFQDPMTSLNPVMPIGSQIVEALKAGDRGLSRGIARERAIELLALVGVPQPARRVDQYPYEYSGGMRQRAMIAMAIANHPKILIADEPTTALDVTIQAQVLDVLKQAQGATGAATILITHDLGVIAEMADRVIVMYAGRIVESGGVQAVFANPRHPYTVGLMASRPQLDSDMRRLFPIPGLPPTMIEMPPGCPFHPRCELSQGRDICRDELPTLVLADSATSSHMTACHFAKEVPGLHTRVESLISGPGSDPANESSGSSAETATGRATSVPTGDTVLHVEDLHKYFPVRSGFFRRVQGMVRAVDGVSLTLRAGETLGLVGESGCGKSTTGRTIMRLLDPTSGRIVFRGRDITELNRKQLRSVRMDMQILFQDPFSSLDPRMRVHEIIAEPLRIHGLYGAQEGPARVTELMELVGLDPGDRNRYAHQFSGGQRQRIGIARAIALNPTLMILDEPVSALDVSIQAQVINLLMELQEKLGLAYIFIAHDLGVVRQISHRVAVMYLGKIVEVGETDEIYQRPTHPYTQSLLSAVPIADPSQRDRKGRILLSGDVPNPADPPSGCNFRTRCFKAVDACALETPALEDRGDHGHMSACFFPELRTAP